MRILGGSLRYIKVSRSDLTNACYVSEGKSRISSLAVTATKSKTKAGFGLAANVSKNSTPSLCLYPNATRWPSPRMIALHSLTFYLYANLAPTTFLSGKAPILRTYHRQSSLIFHHSPIPNTPALRFSSLEVRNCLSLSIPDQLAKWICLTEVLRSMSEIRRHMYTGQVRMSSYL